jgi:pimeloyl-ACP methyl ester carboxylesterase
MSRTLLLGLLLGSAVCAAQESPTLELDNCRINAGPGFPGIKARCGTFVRPLDPTDPASVNIELSVAVVPALSLEPEPDPLVLIAGGPGQASITFYAGWARAFERVRRDRDILLVDQRGTGESAPMTCDVEDDIVEGQYSTEQTLAITQECLQSLPYDPRFFTTSVAVTDLEALRIALGYPLLNIYGISYGSRVAQHFARRFPASTRTVILDGVVPPQIALGPEIATESQLAVENVLERCTNNEHCHERFPTIHQDFVDLRQQIDSDPPTVAVPDPLSGRIETVELNHDRFAIALRLLLYGHRSIALLPLLIHEAANGNYVPIAAQFQMTAIALSESLSIGMHNAIMCTEDMPFVDDDKVDHVAIAASYLGAMQLEALQTICSVWPAGVLDDDFKTPVATNVPFMVLSGSVDPITPPRYAIKAAVDLEKAWLLTVENQGHGQAPVGCMPRLISEFISTATLEGVDTSCIDQSFTMPFFLDFAGPAP